MINFQLDVSWSKHPVSYLGTGQQSPFRILPNDFYNIVVLEDMYKV
jgi:hypothetical protein